MNSNKTGTQVLGQFSVPCVWLTQSKISMHTVRETGGGIEKDRRDKEKSQAGMGRMREKEETRSKYAEDSIYLGKCVDKLLEEEKWHCDARLH